MSLANIFGFTENDIVDQSKNIMDENELMQEKALDNPATTEPPSSYKGGTQLRPVGGTMEDYGEKDINIESLFQSVGLFESNVNYIDNIGNRLTKLSVDYVTNTLTNLNRNLVLDGKTYTLDKIPELMKNNDASNKIVKLVDDLQEDPELNTDVKWKNIENRINSVILFGQFQFFNKKFNDEMYSAAKSADAMQKESAQWAGAVTKFLFDKDGKHRTFEEFNKYKAEEYNRELQIIKKDFPDPYEQDVVTDKNGLKIFIPKYNVAKLHSVGMGQRSDMNYWLYRKGEGYYRDSEGRMRRKPGVYNEMGLPIDELMMNKRENQIYQLNKFYNSIDYYDLMSEVSTYYDKMHSNSTKFSAIAENKYTKDNKGGMYQTQTGSIEFNFNNARQYDEKADDIAMKAEIKEFNLLESFVKNDPGKILYAAGKVSYLPTQNINAKKDILELFRFMNEDKTAKTNSPRGKIEFQADVKGADDNYYDAYTFTFFNKYIDQQKFKGTKNKETKEYEGLGWKNNRIYAKDGFTIYIPRDISRQQIELAKKYEKASTTSGIEALLNVKGTLDFKIPNLGSLTIVNQPELGGLQICGYLLKYNPVTGKYSSLSISTLPEIVVKGKKSGEYVKVVDENDYGFTSGDKTTGTSGIDVDNIIYNNLIRKLFKEQFYLNEDRKRQATKLKGVKDPNQLTGQQ